MLTPSETKARYEQNSIFELRKENERLTAENERLSGKLKDVRKSFIELLEYTLWYYRKHITTAQLRDITKAIDELKEVNE
jgi:predicted nuclease with TOPRIM domain